MSNPVITVGSSITAPADPEVTRKTFTRIVYEEQRFFVYADGEFDPTYTTFDPTNKGQRFFIFINLDEAFSSTKPDFVSPSKWDKIVDGEQVGLKLAASGFITAVNSIMPKIIIPSLKLVDNGINTDDFAFFAFADLTTVPIQEGFNWEIVSVNGTPVGDASTEFYKYGQIGAFFGSQYVSMKAKDDEEPTNTTVVKLVNPPLQSTPGFPLDPPKGDWLEPDGSDLVVTGAFCLMLNVVPSRPGTSSPNDVQDNEWGITIEFGQVKMELSQTGAMKVKITDGTAATEDNTLTANLSEGKTKEGPPQQQHIDDKEPFIILVYPVWNGIVVGSGNQDSIATVGAASTFIPKRKGPSILEAPYSAGFDPSAPAEVEVGVGAGADNVTVDFGSEMTVTAESCRFEIAYLPAFFSKNCWFDEWFVVSDDNPGVVSFAYNVYPIWTNNDTAAALTPAPTVIDSGIAGPLTDTHWSYIKWRLENTDHSRHAGEIFGSILEVIETQTKAVKNGNGSFGVSFAGGTPGDPSPLADWWKYILNVSISTSLDGSSGSITVDKFGKAGQDAVTTQSIGAVTISATGGEGTVAGSIFSGLGLGIGDSISSDGATWNIPLVGLEKKLDDIALIIPPFFDGEFLDDTIDFLTRYAGIVDDLSAAPSAGAIRLSVSEDVNVAVFDWKSGTNVKAALDDVMEDTLHTYVVRDGKIFFYQLDSTTGLPLFLGPDRSGPYPDTKIVQYDQTPDFEDLRNDIVVIGLEGVPGGQGTSQNPPSFIRTARRITVTTPDVPWAKNAIIPLPGLVDQATVDDRADKIQEASKTYELLGSLTIPGNADIKPYDQWGSFVIFSVSHSLDFEAKSWTTSLELMRQT